VHLVCIPLNLSGSKTVEDACRRADHAAPAAAQERAEADEGGRGGAGELDAFGWGSIVLGGPLDPGDEWERRLAVGAQIACRLRGAVRQQLGAPLAGMKSWEHGLKECRRVVFSRMPGPFAWCRGKAHAAC